MYSFLKKYSSTILCGILMGHAQAGEFTGNLEIFRISLPILFNSGKQKFLDYKLYESVTKTDNATHHPAHDYTDNSWENIRYWIEKGANPNHEVTPLGPSITIDLINNGPAIVEFQHEPIIFEAIRQSKPTIVEFLISKGSMVNRANNRGDYPLKFVMFQNFRKDLFSRDNLTEQTPDRVKIMELLLKNGASPDYFEEDSNFIKIPLATAARNWNYDYINLLLDNGANTTLGLFKAMHDYQSGLIPNRTEENQKIFVKFIQQLSDAGASWDFTTLKAFDLNFHTPNLMHEIAHFSVENAIKIMQHAPIQIKITQKDIHDARQRAWLILCALRGKKLGLPIKLDILRRALSIDEILAHRSLCTQLKYYVARELVAQKITMIQKLLAVPSHTGRTLLEDFNIALGSDEHEELLDGTKLQDDYQTFLDAGDYVYALPENNIVKGMFIHA